MNCMRRVDCGTDGEVWSRLLIWWSFVDEDKGMRSSSLVLKCCPGFDAMCSLIFLLGCI